MRMERKSQARRVIKRQARCLSPQRVAKVSETSNHPFRGRLREGAICHAKVGLARLIALRER